MGIDEGVQEAEGLLRGVFGEGDGLGFHFEEGFEGAGGIVSVLDEGFVDRRFWRGCGLVGLEEEAEGLRVVW